MMNSLFDIVNRHSVDMFEASVVLTFELLKRPSIAQLYTSRKIFCLLKWSKEVMIQFAFVYVASPGEVPVFKGLHKIGIREYFE